MATAVPTRPLVRSTVRPLMTLIAVLLACVVVATSCTDGSGGSGDAERPPSPPPTPRGLERFYGQRPTWGRCPARAATITGVPGAKIASGAECTRVSVPLDYDDPEKGSIRLFVARRKATRRSGSSQVLFFNPGGPGGPGAGMVASGQWAATPRVARRFDIVGFDPRGVGLSQPVSCGPYEDEDIPPIDGRRAFDEYVRSVRDDARLCVRDTGALLGEVGTPNVARDLDILRAVLGADRLDYVGVSYGTYIGVQYLARFGRNAGRLVLDSVVDPTASERTIVRQQAESFERLYRDFLDWCTGSGRRCPVGATPDRAYDATVRLVESLEATPLPTRTGRRLTDDNAVVGIAAALYSQQVWPLLELGLGQAMRERDGSTLLYLADLYRGIDPETGEPANNMEEAAVAVTCLDRPAAGSPAEIWRVDLPALRQRSELFGTFTGLGLVACAVWPERPERGSAARVPTDPEAVPPTLVVSNTRDPATPHSSAEELARQLPGAVLVSREDAGHGAYATGNRCVDEVVDAFLLDGTLPDDDVTCEPE